MTSYWCGADSFDVGSSSADHIAFSLLQANPNMGCYTPVTIEALSIPTTELDMVPGCTKLRNSVNILRKLCYSYKHLL